MKPFDIQTEAAVQKSSIERAVAIVGDLQQRNYGMAEMKARVLVHQLRHEDQERRETEEAIHNAFEDTVRATTRHHTKTAPKPSCETCVSKHIHICDPPCGDCGAFENYKKREEPDRFMEALGEVLREQHEVPPQGSNEDAFERQILESLANLEKPDAYPMNGGYYEGMKNAYRYALAIYRRSYK